MSDTIAWYCKADKSWGVCALDSLVIVRKADMTDEELNILEEADEMWSSPYAAIVGAHNRLKGEAS